MLRAASGQSSSWEDRCLSTKQGGTQALELSVILCSKCLPPTLSPRTQELPARSSKAPESSAQTQEPQLLLAKTALLTGSHPWKSRPESLCPTDPPSSPPSLYRHWGEGVAPLADPSTAQLPASLISIRCAPSVTTATSCSAPSGMTAPAILAKGRPVHCPVSHSSAQPDLRVLSLQPAAPPTWP